MADATAQDEGGEEDQEEVFHIGPLMFGVGLVDWRISDAFARRQYVGNEWEDIRDRGGTLRRGGILMPCVGLVVRLIVRRSLKRRPGLATRRTSPQ